MKGYKKLLALFISIIMIMSLLVGCGGDKDITQDNSSNLGSGQNGSKGEDLGQEDGGTGAEGTNKTGLPIVDERLVQKMLINKNPDFNPNSDMWFLKEMEKMKLMDSSMK